MSGDRRLRHKLRWAYLLDNEHEKDEASSSTSSDPPEDCNWWVLSGVFLIQFLVYGMISSYGVLIAWQVEKKGVTLKLAFWTPAVFTAAWFISDPLSRKISSASSARRLGTAGILLIVAGIVSSTTLLPTAAHLLGYGLVAGMGTSLILTQVEVMLRSYWGSSGSVGFRIQCVPLLSAAVAQFVGPLLLFGLLIQFGPSGAPLLHAAVVFHALFGVIALRAPPPPKTPLPVLNRYRPRSFTVVDMDELDTIVQRDRFLTAEGNIPATEPSLPDATMESVTSRVTNENSMNVVNLFSIYNSRSRNENGVEILPKILEETEEDINAEAAEIHVGSPQPLHGSLTKWNPLETPTLADIPETGISKSLEGFLDDVERERKRNLRRAQTLKERSRWSMGTLEEILPYAEWDDLQMSSVDSEYLKVVKCDDVDESDNVVNNISYVDYVDEPQECSMKRWHILDLDSPICEPEEQASRKQTQSQNLYMQCSKGGLINGLIPHDRRSSKETCAPMSENITFSNEETTDIAGSIKTSDNFLVHFQNSNKNKTASDVNNREEYISTSTLQYNTEKDISPSDTASSTISWLKPPPKNKRHRWSMGSLEEMVKIKLKWDGLVKDDITMNDMQKWHSMDSSHGNELHNHFNHDQNMEHSNQVHSFDSVSLKNSKQEEMFSDHALQVQKTETENISELIGINTVDPCSSQSDSVIDCGSPLSVRRLLPTRNSFEEEVKKTSSSLKQFHKLFSWTYFTQMKCKCQCPCHVLPDLSLRGYFAEPYLFPSLLLHFTSRFCPIVFFCLTPTISRRWKLITDEEAAFSVSISGFVWFCFLLLMPWCSKLTTSKRKWLYISGTCSAALALYLLSRASSHSHMTLGCALFGLGQGVTTATGNSIVRDSLGPWSLSKLDTMLHIVSGLLVLLFAGIIDSFLEAPETSGLSHCFSLIAALEIIAGFSWLVKPMLSVIIHIYHQIYCPNHHHRNSAVLWNADSHLLLPG